MAAVNKIEKYRLEERVLALSAEGLTTAQIAERVSADLAEAGIQDSISQPTVSRFLKSVRQERSEATRQRVQDHIKEVVPADLEALEEVEGWMLSQFRNDHLDVEARARQGMRAVKIIETKLRFAGILEDPASGRPPTDPVDLDAFKTEVEALRCATDHSAGTAPDDDVDPWSEDRSLH